MASCEPNMMKRQNEVDLGVDMASREPHMKRLKEVDLGVDMASREPQMKRQNEVDLGVDMASRDSKMQKADTAEDSDDDEFMGASVELVHLKGLENEVDDALKIAIKKYNEENNSNYQYVRMLKVFVAMLSSLELEMTFEAKDSDSDSDADAETFLAVTYQRFPSRVVDVHSCEKLDPIMKSKIIESSQFDMSCRN